jgi:GAF domain
MDAPEVARLAALVDEHSTQDLLSRAQEMCVLCQQATGVSGVALSIAGGGAQQLSSTVCGTDALSLHLEELQLGLAEGPIADALNTTFPVVAADLADVLHPRWLWFAPAAVEAGAAALFVFPVCRGARCLGALSLYRNTSGDLTVEQFDDLRALAEAAAVILLPGYANSDQEAGSWALGVGTGFLPEVPQAVGMIMSEWGVGPEHALARLRGHAFAESQLISEVAHEIVAGRLRLEDDAV